MNAIDLDVSGMRCGSCIAHVKKVLGALGGVATVDVDLAAGRVRVGGEHLPDSASLANALNAAGYPAAASDPAAQQCADVENGVRGAGCCCG
ncbi:MAG: cation transporter [Pseudomonadota bacterium]